MGRPKRSDEAGVIYHALNRSNRRATIFHKDEDYAAFERILSEALERCPDLELFAYCLMPNHWHLVLRPTKDGEMSRFAQWLTLTHTQRYNAHFGTTGEGHLYQGRYKSFPIQDDDHFLSVCRYVERNAYTAQLCKSPDTWKYGSLYRWQHGSSKEKSLLDAWPIPRRSNWLRWVIEPLSAKEQEQLRWSIRRGAPFGTETWVESTARMMDLESTLRPRGRPRQQPTDQNGT
jgi:putative transposase